MKSVYVVGGQQKPNAPTLREWQGHRKGVVIEVDIETGAAETRYEYTSPPEVCPDEMPSFLFKAATLAGDRLYLCTQTEVLICSVPDFTRVGYVSLPCFNDVHHVRPTAQGSLQVVSTGLDLVVEITPEGRVVREWNVLGDEPWGGRFSRDIDYRKVPTTKPHAAHPNFVFEVGSELWATRFEQRDAVSLTSPGRRIEIAIERPHDGILFGDEIYFTTVDGHVVVADPRTAEVVRVHDLQQFDPESRAAGWTRSLLVLDRDLVIVGFSRIRRTKHLENLAWVRRRILGGDSRRSVPSRIALFDLRAGRRLWEHDLEKHGMSVVFSIHPAAS